MSRFSIGRFLAFLIALLALQAVLLLWNGMLLITVHEGDAMHTAQILLRMERGEIPHVDFLTPIGILAFAPIFLFMGFGVGKAILLGNLLVAAVAIPAIFWVGVTRLGAGLAYGFGAGIIFLITAMVHGEAVQVTSISMYYNRWAWAVCFLLVLLVILPAKERKSQVLDGLIIGLGLSFLALSKMTFFVALLPGIAIAIMLRKHWKTLIVGMLTGLAVAGLVTFLTGGFGFWPAYLGDLLTVRNSGVRSFPSKTFGQLMIGPSFVQLNLLLLLSIILLRQSGQMIEGVILLLLAPAFVYITYQNWGNDPQWLFVLGILLLALLPKRPSINAWGWDTRVAMGIVAALVLGLISPSALNIVFSATNHARLDPAEFSVLLKEPRHSNLVVQTKLLYAPITRQQLTLPNAKMAALGEKSGDRRDYVLYGQPLEYCKLSRGLGGVMQNIARELDELGYMQGKSVYVADLLSNLWLFGDTVPVKGGSPWYYGGDTGLGSADYLLVPFCPSTTTDWGLVLDELEKDDSPKFTEVHRTELYVLLKRQTGE